MPIKTEVHATEQIVFTIEDDNGKVIARTTILFGYDPVYKERFCFLSNRFVDLEHRSQGFDEQILDVALTEARRRGVSRVITNTHFRLKGKQRWHQQKGFQKQGFYFCLELVKPETGEKRGGGDEKSSIPKREIETMKGLIGRRKRGEVHRTT